MKKNIFAADIGGTNSRFAHFEVTVGEAPVMLKSVWLPSAGAKSFGEILAQLEATDFSLALNQADVVVFAVAGPVEGKVYSKPPLISWDIDLRLLGAGKGAKQMFLINDFIAQAFACASPVGAAAEKILPGTAVADGAVAVIGAGTGLGKAILARDISRFVALPSEGAHANFCVETAEEFEFQEFVRAKVGGGYVTLNDIVSGAGIRYIHEFLTGQSLEPAEIAKTFSPESKTLALASRFYGRAARNFAFESLAFGGVFVAGGIAVKNPQLLKHAEFERSFRSSRVHAALLSKIPVSLIANESSGLWGAAYYGWQEVA